MKRDLIGKKQITLNMMANVVSYSANILISFVLTPFLINSLGKETYSFYPMANTFVMYMSVLTNAMNSIASRFVTVSIARDEKEEANKYFSSTLCANLVMSAILLIPMILIVLFLDKFMEVPVNSKAAIQGLFSFVFASAIINISSSVFGIATFAKNRIDLRSLRELVTASLKLILFIVLYKFLPPSILYVGIVAITVAVVNLMFQMTYTKLLLPEVKIKRCNISLTHTKVLFSSSCWNAINTFGNIMLAGMTMILANTFYGAAASGSYSIVQTVPQFINGVIVMLVGVFYPVITYKYAQGDKDALLHELKNALKIVGSFGCAVITVFSALSKEFFMLWVPEEDAVMLSILSFITILPHFFISCLWSLNNLNVVMNKVKIPALFTVFCGVLNVSCAFIAYKLFHPGLISLSIISSSIQIIWIGVLITQYSSKNIGVPWYTFYIPLVKALCLAGVLIPAIVKVKSFFTINSWIRFMVLGACTGIIVLGCFVAVMIGARNIKSTALSLLKSRNRKTNK